MCNISTWGFDNTRNEAICKAVEFTFSYQLTCTYKHVCDDETHMINKVDLKLDKNSNEKKYVLNNLNLPIFCFYTLFVVFDDKAKTNLRDSRVVKKKI